MLKKLLAIALIQLGLVTCGNAWAAKTMLHLPSGAKPGNGPNVGNGQTLSPHIPPRPILPAAASATALQHLQGGVCKRNSASPC